MAADLSDSRISAARHTRAESPVNYNQDPNNYQNIPQPYPGGEQRFLPAVAKAIAGWFPELNGRSLAVSDVTITKDNVPTLPLVMVAFTKSMSVKPVRSSTIGYIDITDEFIVEFWLKPERYKRIDGTETPFWSYYPYEYIRNTLLQNILAWRPPGNERIYYISMAQAADSLSVMLTFKFGATFQWCPEITDMGEIIARPPDFNLRSPDGTCPPYWENSDP